MKWLVRSCLVASLAGLAIPFVLDAGAAPNDAVIAAYRAGKTPPKTPAASVAELTERVAALEANAVETARSRPALDGMRRTLRELEEEIAFFFSESFPDETARKARMRTLRRDVENRLLMANTAQTVGDDALKKIREESETIQGEIEALKKRIAESPEKSALDALAPRIDAALASARAEHDLLAEQAVAVAGAKRRVQDRLASLR